MLTLRDLAIHRDMLPEYNERLSAIIQRYQKREAFIRRLREQRLL